MHDRRYWKFMKIHETAMKLLNRLIERLSGRYLVDDLKDSATGEIIMSKDKIITEADAKSNL